MRRRDFIFAVITGLMTGFVAWRVLAFLGYPSLGTTSYAWLVILIPVLWILGVTLGYFLSRWIPSFSHFGKYVAVGFTNSAIDFGILNALIFLTGHATGVRYTIFKTISFIIAVTHSYFWNKFWVFGAGRSGRGKSEFFKFIATMVATSVVNVGIASWVTFSGPLWGVSVNGWANFGAVVGSAIALIFSFTGLRLLVFKK